MSETIQATILKKGSIPRLTDWKTGKDTVEHCFECEGVIFYVANTYGLVYNPTPDYQVTGRNTDWENYKIELAYNTHFCATCGTSQGGNGTWEHTIIEIEDDGEVEDYKEALEFLQTGTLPAGNYHDSILRLAEEIREKTAKYWTRHNINQAIQNERKEAAKKGLKQIPNEQRDQNTNGNDNKTESNTAK